MAKEDINSQSEITKTDTKNSLEKNIEIAQALNQEELNNLSTPSKLELLTHDDNKQESSGAPSEQTQLDNEQSLPNEQDVGEVISADDLEGASDDASPQEGVSDDSPEESIIAEGVPPEDQTINGSPTQGFVESEIQISEENNVQNLPPETTEQTGEPAFADSDSQQVIDDQPDIQDNIIEPEESIANAGPLDLSPDNLQTQETVIAQNGPEESADEGSPVQTVLQTSEDEEVQEDQIDDVAQLIPEQTQTNGNPSEVVGEGQQIDVALNIVGPSEGVSTGNPLEEEIQITNNIQLAEVSDTSQINPENVPSDGNPQEGLLAEAISEVQDDSIPPVETVLAGDPLQGESVEGITDQQIELAEILPQAPKEEGVQDYINEVAKLWQHYKQAKMQLKKYQLILRRLMNWHLTLEKT